MKRFILLVVTALFLCTLPLTAGVYIKSINTHVGKEKEEVSELFIEQDRIRIQLSESEEYPVIIFRHDKQVMWMIDEQKKTYMEMTKEDVENIKKQMDNMQQMMSEQLKNVPEEQRQMMEEMMKNQMSQMQSAKKMKVSYKEAGQEKVDQWQCTKYEGYINGTKKNDVWAASWNNLGLNADDFQGLKHMGTFFEILTEEVEEFYNLESFNGFPVQIYDYKDGDLDMKTYVKEIASKSLDASLFDLPAGLTKKKFPMGSMGQQGMQ
jgi:hypothetical protein